MKGEIDIAALDLRVGIIRSVSKHETADKLYCEMIDVGEENLRPIASGLANHYTLEEMQNRRLIVVANLKPRKLVGFQSFGMVLCAAKTDPVTGVEQVEFVDPPASALPGDRVSCEGFASAPLTASQVEKQKAFEMVGAKLKVNEQGVACWNDLPLIVLKTGEGCFAPTLRDAIVR